ncbi:MAG: septum formation family protein [Rhodococcus sp. (in: high G+C Gram-positive bacteria)]|uniref:septum formation family protein n=1 Tax=Rhodococcus sp. TaxID=1831 RepID=UPI003BAEFFD6
MSAEQPKNGGQPENAPRTMSASTTRRTLAAVAAGAVVAAVATFAIAGGFNRSENLPPHSDSAGPQATSHSTEGGAFASAAAGDCLDWTPSTDPKEDRKDVAEVDCSEEHRFEVAAPLDLGVYPGAEFGPGSRYPGALRFAALRDEHCVAAVNSYLGARFDPYGKFSVGLMFPSETGWDSGERTLRCGLQLSSTAGTLLPFTGRVADHDQSNVWDASTCIGISQNVPTDPVDCAQPHAFEVISVVDLATRFPDSMPSVEDQDKYLEGVCTQASNEYLGSADALRNKTLTLFWDNLELDSWLAGSRRVNCSVGKETDSGGFATITGGAKGDILIDGVAPVPPPPVPEGRSLPTPLPGAAAVPGA